MSRLTGAISFCHNITQVVTLTEGTAMAPDGLVAAVVVDHDVGLTDRPGSTEVDRVWTKVGICKQGLAVPRSGVLYDGLETVMQHIKSIIRTTSQIWYWARAGRTKAARDAAVAAKDRMLFRPRADQRVN